MAYPNPLEAYQNASKAAMRGPEIEAAVLTKAALRLKECQNDWDRPDRDKRLYAAIQYNQKIWSVFQAELSETDNPLPKALRLDLLRLGAIVDRRCVETLAFPDPQKLTLLIDINNNIAAGLRQQANQVKSNVFQRKETHQAFKQNDVPAVDPIDWTV